MTIITYLELICDGYVSVLFRMDRMKHSYMFYGKILALPKNSGEC